MSAVPSAGHLDRRVTIQMVSLIEDPVGGRSETWAEGETVWAKFLPMSDGEKFRGGLVLADRLGWFTVRSSGITRAIKRGDRLVCDGTTWDVVAIKEIGRQRFLEFTARAVDSSDVAA